MVSKEPVKKKLEEGTKTKDIKMLAEITVAVWGQNQQRNTRQKSPLLLQTQQQDIRLKF